MIPCAGLAGRFLGSFKVITMAPPEARGPSMMASAPRSRLILDMSLICISFRMSDASSYTISSMTMAAGSGLLRMCISLPFMIVTLGSLVAASKAV